MVRYGLFLACLASATGCASAPQRTAPPAAATPSAPAVASKQFAVMPPGPEWKVIPGARFEGAPPAMLALVNESAKSIIKFDAVKSQKVSPSMMALNASDMLAANGVSVSEIDFSDASGDRASFTFVAKDGADEKRGKVVVFRLRGDDEVTFVATGIWPPDADGSMTKTFDAVIATARIK